jgi:hypothetical protein
MTELFLTVAQAARMIAPHIAGRDPISLLGDMRRGRGGTIYPALPFITLPGRRVGYRRLDVLRWIEALPPLTPMRTEILRAA